MRDILGIAVAILIALATQIVTPWSLIWWLAVLASGGIALVVCFHLVLRSGAAVGSYFLIAGCVFAVLSVLGFLGWIIVPASKDAVVEAVPPFFYFDVDILDPQNLVAANPGRIVSGDDIPFHNVTSWFSPSSAKRNPNPPGGPYWSMGELQVVITPLYQGAFWTGKMIPPGDYCVESNSIREGRSVSFGERLQIVPFEDKLIQLIDVWKDGRQRIYSTPRPPGFKDSPVPWLN